MIGADVMHPAPGAEGRPSFTTVVSSIDSMAAKYIALSRVQAGRQELIDDLEEMCTVRCFHFNNSSLSLTAMWYYRKPWERYRGTRLQWKNVKLHQRVWSFIGVCFHLFLLSWGLVTDCSLKMEFRRDSLRKFSQKVSLTIGISQLYRRISNDSFSSFSSHRIAQDQEYAFIWNQCREKTNIRYF